MDDQRWCSYAGVYQVYAWQQGYANKAVVFRLPDENFSTSTAFNADGFDLVEFMAVVADIDDGGIHYWKYIATPTDGERFLVLACTEDDSMIGSTKEYWATFHSAHDVGYWKEVA